MRREAEKKHNIDILFQMAVFLLFTFFSIVLLLLAVNFYRSIVERSERNENARVAGAYIREMIHQNDEQNGISIAEFDGIDCIRIAQTKDYVCYLYLKDGYLCELYTKEGAKVSSIDGQEIVPLKSLDFSMPEPHTLLVECEDTESNQERILITIRSDMGGNGS